MNFRLLLLILTFPHFMLAQKLKYKDIFPLLEAKQYDQAEAQLAIFFADPKNATEANAWYQYGQIMENKSQLRDLFTDTTGFISAADSAILFYKRAIANIDEKELKRNDQYYQSFYRRDLRTGEFGIKLSDVQLDIEKKIEGLETKIRQIRLLFQTLVLLESKEKSNIETFNQLASKYTSFNDFLMQAGIDQIKMLGQLNNEVEEFKKTVQEAIDLAQALGSKEKYTQIKYNRIRGGLEVIEPSLSIASGKLETWDLERFVGDSKMEINSDVAYLKSELIALDKSLAEAKTLIMEGQKKVFAVSIPEQIEVLSNRYHKKSVPLDMANARIKENIVLTLSNPIITKSLADSTQIFKNLSLADSILFELSSMKNYLLGLDQRVLSEVNYYKEFYYERYRGENNMITAIKEKQTWVENQLQVWQDHRRFWDLKANWGISGSDTISLRPVSLEYSGKYQTIKSWKLPENQVLLAGRKQDTQQGFIAMFGEDRKLKHEITFDVKFLKEDFKLSYLADTVSTSNTGTLLYLYSDETADENFHIVNYQYGGKITWVRELNFALAPVSTTFEQQFGRITIFFHEQSAYPIEGGDPGFIMLNLADK